MALLASLAIVDIFKSSLLASLAIVVLVGWSSCAFGLGGGGSGAGVGVVGIDDPNGFNILV